MSLYMDKIDSEIDFLRREMHLSLADAEAMMDALSTEWPSACAKRLATLTAEQRRELDAETNKADKRYAEIGALLREMPHLSVEDAVTMLDAAWTETATREDVAQPWPPVGDWDELCALTPNTECSGDPESLFWRLKKRTEAYRFRIVSRPLYYRQHLKAFQSLRREDGKAIGPVISPAWDFKERHLDATWAKEGYMPDNRYSCLVIDRDSGDLRILTAGPAVFLPIGDYQKERGILVYGDHAPDWMVRVRIVHGQTGEKTEYALVPLDSVPLTEEEKAKIAAFTAKVDLHKYFVKSTPEAIQALYVRLDPSCKVSPEL